MKVLRNAMMFATALALAGCGGDVVGPGDASADAPSADVPVTDTPPTDAPRVCVTSADCNAGEECLVHEGCATPSYCGPALGRPCTDDIAIFCGCDWVQFTGSSSCPPRSFMFRGPCESSDSGPRACVFPDGRTCAVGASCPAPDGCNTCTCSAWGALACTERACVDAGPPVDGGPAGCTLANGAICPVGATCIVSECTSCFCAAPGRALCTGGCLDAGTVDAGVADGGAPVDVPLPRSCNSSSDCPPSMVCEGAQGCDTIWTCVPAHPCTADFSPFCGCDGVTFHGSSTCPERKYSHRGECP